MHKKSSRYKEARNNNKAVFRLTPEPKQKKPRLNLAHFTDFEKESDIPKGSYFIDIDYNFKNTKKLPRFDKFKPLPKKTLEELQAEFREDHLKVYDAKLTCLDKYYLIYRHGYGLDYHPTSVSHGLSMVFLFAGNDSWRFAQGVANTAIAEMKSIDWVRDWISKYYPHWSKFLEDLLLEVKKLRKQVNFHSARNYKQKIYDGSKVQGVSGLFSGEYLQLEVEFNDGSVEKINQNDSTERKSPQEHTRRKHTKRVRYGKGRQLTKWVDIAETVVNEGVA